MRHTQNTPAKTATCTLPRWFKAGPGDPEDPMGAPSGRRAQAGWETNGGRAGRLWGCRPLPRGWRTPTEASENSDTHVVFILSPDFLQGLPGSRAGHDAARRNTNF